MFKVNLAIIGLFLTCFGVTIFGLQEKAPKKNVVVFSSTGGGGHTAAASAITEYLSADAGVTTVQIFKDVLGNKDLISLASGGKYSAEKFYNACLQSNLLYLGNALAACGRLYFERFSCLIEASVRSYLLRLVRLRQKPDLLISVVPFINGAIARVAAQNNIPFMIIAPDFDITNYMVGFSMVPDKFSFCTPHRNELTEKLLKNAGLPKDCIYPCGLPVRSQFLTSYSRSKERQAYFKDHKLHSSSHSFTIMLLMGAVGSDVVYTYTKTIAEMKTLYPINLIVCVGRNEALAKRIGAIIPQENITITIQGYTEQVARLMAISQPLITKPGPTTISEAIHMKLPLVLDHTKGLLSWEKANSDFVVESNIGYVLSKISKLPECIRFCANNPAALRLIKKRMGRLKQDPRTVIQEIYRSIC